MVQNQKRNMLESFIDAKLKERIVYDLDLRVKVKFEINNKHLKCGFLLMSINYTYHMCILLK